MSKKDTIIINRTCPQCFHSFGSKAEFISHMTEDYKHKYSKAAANREWKKADAAAKTEELAAQIEALGLVQCKGCQAAINPAEAACSDPDRYTPSHLCKACCKEIPGIGVVVREMDTWAYWYPSDNEYRRNPLHPCLSGCETAQAAERELRKHQAQRRLETDTSNYMDCLAIVIDEDDKREFLSLVAWHKAYNKLGYRPESLSDPRYREFSDTEHAIYCELRQAA